jgi:signal transduction histidine kinase
VGAPDLASGQTLTTDPAIAATMVPVTARRADLLVAMLVVLVAVEMAAGLWFDHLERRAGRSDLVGVAGPTWIFILGILSATVVGAVVAHARPRNPVGWLFLALAAAMMMAGPVDGYADYALFGRPGSLPGGRSMAIAADKEFLPWLVLVALVLFLTPTGHHLSRRWRWAAHVTVASGVGALLLSIVSTHPLDAPYQHITNPTALPALQPAADAVRVGLVYLVGLGLIASGVSLVVRFRRSRGDERRQLLWLVFVVVPLPVFVVLAFVGASNDLDALTIVASGGFVTLVPAAAGLSVLRYRLYDVERLVASTLTWVLLSTILLATYGLVVWTGARAVPSGPVSPALSATVGALAAAALAFPLRGWLQDQLDRRFNRRAYDARRVIGAALATEQAGTDVEAVLRDALRDDTLTVSYPAEGGAWVTPTGDQAETGVHVDVDRHGRVVARIGYDPDRNDAEAVRVAASLAAAELDNARLRAELARQVGEIAASRERLTHAQRRERRKIERDLHDGAQQSLLALAFELQGARLNGDPERMRQALGDGAVAARAAVRELRDLANGLHPAALADGGLAAALDDMARHSPVPMRLNVDAARLDPGLEFTAWSVIGEAVVNAQKHAAAQAIDVDVQPRNGDLRLRVHDDGRGGANPDGPGLRGLRDRVEAARGRLTVTSGRDGTTIEAVLPCGS